MMLGFVNEPEIKLYMLPDILHTREKECFNILYTHTQYPPIEYIINLLPDIGPEA